MASPSSPRGLLIDLVTPLKDNREIDGRSLERLLHRVLPHVQAVLIASPHMGEGTQLSAGQREELLGKALGVIRGQVPVLVWVTQDTEQETQQALEMLSKKVKRGRYPGPVCWVDTPLYYHSNRGLVSHYRKLTSWTEEAWLLHNDPALIDQLALPLKRKNLRTSILRRLIEIEGIQGILYHGSLDRAVHYEKAIKARPDFKIYDGEESRFLTHPSVSGVVSAGANLSPRAWFKITDASLNLRGSREDYPDRLEQIWKTGQYLQRLMDLYRSSAVQIIKRVLAEAGILESPTCLMKPAEVGEKVRSIIEEMKNFGDHVK